MTDTPTNNTDNSETERTEEELRNMETKQLRKKHPSGIMKLFNKPSMRFVIDALLERPPKSEFTKTELANQAGISTETLRSLFPTLTELGIITGVDETQRYRFRDTTPVSKALIRLGGAVNGMSLETAQTSLEHIDNFPDTRLSYYCEECGERGTYVGEVFTGHVLECPNECMEWTIQTENPPGSAIRLETTLTADAELETLNSQAETHGMDSLTPHEQALVSCAFDDDTTPPMFTEQQSKD